MGRAFEFRKARKFKRWGKMAKVFSRLGKDILIAVKAGGPDPDTNSKLRAVMQNCRAANMPKENVMRAIKNASDKDTADLKEVTFEGYAPHGIAIFVEAATDNNNRTVANVRAHFNKLNGTFGTTGSVVFMFDRKCQFKVPKVEGLDLEELELEMIDYGVEEIFEEEDGIMMYAEFESFGSIQSALEEKKMEIISSGFERIPNITKALNEAETAEVDKLLERLEEDEDVQNVYHTMIS